MNTELTAELQATYPNIKPEFLVGFADCVQGSLDTQMIDALCSENAGGLHASEIFGLVSDLLHSAGAVLGSDGRCRNIGAYGSDLQIPAVNTVLDLFPDAALPAIIDAFKDQGMLLTGMVAMLAKTRLDTEAAAVAVKPAKPF